MLVWFVCWLDYFVGGTLWLLGLVNACGGTKKGYGWVCKQWGSDLPLSKAAGGNYRGIVVLIVAAEAELLLQCLSVTEGDPLPSREVVVVG